MEIPKQLGIAHRAEYKPEGYLWESFGGVVQFVFPDLDANGRGERISIWHLNEGRGMWEKIDTTIAYQEKENIPLWSGYVYGLETDETYIICPEYQDELVIRSNLSRGDLARITIKGSLYSNITLTRDDDYSKTIYNTEDFIPEFQYDKAKEMNLTLVKLDFDEDIRTNKCILSKYSQGARDIFFETCFQSTELHPILGKFSNIPALELERAKLNEKNVNIVDSSYTDEQIIFTKEGRLTRFPDGKKIYVMLNLNSNRYGLDSIVNNWKEDINHLFFGGSVSNKRCLIGGVIKVNDSGEYLLEKKEYPDGCFIYLTIDEYEPQKDYETFGKIVRTKWDPVSGATLEAEVYVNVGDKINYAKSVIYEELTQALGCVNDVYCEKTSLFSQFQYANKVRTNDQGYYFTDRSGKPTVDGEVLLMLYKEFQPGTKASDAIFKVMPSCGGIVGLPFCYTDHYEGNYKYKISTCFSIRRQARLVYESGGYRLYWGWNKEQGFSNLQQSDNEEYIQSYIPYWSWEKSNGTATDFQTQCAFAAIDKQQGFSVNAFSHYVWNDLVNRTRQLLIKDGKEWQIFEDTIDVGDKYTSLSFENTKMWGMDRELTWLRILSLFYNIDYGMGLVNDEKGLFYQFRSYVLENKKCKGNMFALIANKLNTWRDGYVEDRLYLSSKNIPKIEESNIEEYKKYGAFFYKYGYTHEYLKNQGIPLVKGAKIIIDPRQLRLKNNVDNIINNYIYLGCLGNENAPLEFGIFTAPDRGGKWYRYSKQTYPATAMHFGEEVILKPDNEFPNSKGEYTYANSSMISIELTLDESVANNEFKFDGKIKVLSSPDYNCETSSLTINANFNYVSGIGNSKNTNTFFLGVTAPPDSVKLEYWARKESYIKHVIFQSYIKTGESSWYTWYPVDGPKADKKASHKNVKRNIISKKAISNEEIKRRTDQLGYSQWELTTRAEAMKYIYNLIGEFQNQDYKWLKNNNYNPYHYYTVLAPPQFVAYFKNPVTLEEDVSISYE